MPRPAAPAAAASVLPFPAGPWAWVGAAAFAALVFFSCLHPLFDPDVYLHLRDGRHWVETGFRPGLDPFTYTADRLPVDATEVGFRAGAYLLQSLAGLDALILAKAALLTLTFLALGWLMLRRGLPLWAAATVLLAVRFLPSLWLFFRERPYLFTYLALPLVLLWLETDAWLAGRARRPGPLVWAWPAAIAVWANLHPGFLALFGYLGAYGAQALWDGWRLGRPESRLRAVRLALVAGAAFLAGALNPLGFGLYPYSARMAGSAFFAANIQEWAALDWARHRDLFGFIGFCWGAQVLAWRRLNWTDALLQGIFTYMAVKSVRHAPLFLIAALPPLAANLAHLAARWRPALPSGRAARVLVWSLPVLAAAVGLGAAQHAGSRLGRLGVFPNQYPDAALAWLESRPVSGRWLLPIDWSDYLSWKTNGRVKVFMDGRLPLFGEKLFRDHQAMLTADEPDLPALLDRYGIQVVTVKKDNPPEYYSRLVADGRWALVYFDPLCYAFARLDGPNRAWARDAAFRRLAPWRPSPDYIDTADLPGSLAELERAAHQAPHSGQPAFLKGQILMWTGQRAAARQAFAESLRIWPGQYAAEFNLGLLFAQDGMADQAAPHFQAAIRLAPPALRAGLESQAAAAAPEPTR